MDSGTEWKSLNPSGNTSVSLCAISRLSFFFLSCLFSIVYMRTVAYLSCFSIEVVIIMNSHQVCKRPPAPLPPPCHRPAARHLHHLPISSFLPNLSLHKCVSALIRCPTIYSDVSCDYYSSSS